MSCICISGHFDPEERESKRHFGKHLVHDANRNAWIYPLKHAAVPSAPFSLEDLQGVGRGSWVSIAGLTRLSCIGTEPKAIYCLKNAMAPCVLSPRGRIEVLVDGVKVRGLRCGPGCKGSTLGATMLCMS